MKNRRVLISGGGIAGLTLAFWLKEYGFEPTLVEKNPTLRTVCDWRRLLYQNKKRKRPSYALS